MTTDSQKTALRRAISHCGGQAGLARRLSRLLGREVSQQRVWNALHRDRSIPAEWCMAIQQATGGGVNAGLLRPDLYPGAVP